MFIQFLDNYASFWCITKCYCCVHNPCVHTMSSVFQVGAEIDLSPFRSKITPLMRAIDLGSPNSLIQSLLQSGADPHLSDAFGRTVLYRAAMERNVWAIKWLIAENVDLEAQMPVGVQSVPKTAFHFLFDNCYGTFTSIDAELSVCLEYLRALQALALAGANPVTNSHRNTMTQKQLNEYLNSFISRSEELTCAPCNWDDKSVSILREIRDIVHILTDILCDPLPLTHICRTHIRRSLGRDFRRKLHHLYVPGALQAYLMVYKESDILL